MATNKLGNRSSGCGFGDFSIHAGMYMLDKKNYA